MSINKFTAGTVLLLVGFVGLFLGHQSAAPDIRASVRQSPAAINVDAPAFQAVSLISHTGEALQWNSLGDQPRLVFFGYTFCPDVCPMGLSNMLDAAAMLQAENTVLKPIFITFDPKRDTPSVLKEFISYYGSDILALSGKEEQLRTIASAFGVIFQKSNDLADSEFYLMDHTNFIYLVGADGNLLGYYPGTLDPHALAHAISKDFT